MCTSSLPIRFIHVARLHKISPLMSRVTFGGDDLADYRPSGPDEQVKLYFPKPGHPVRLPEPGDDMMSWYQAYNAIPEAERPWMRSFTIRRHDPDQGTIDIDFVVHGDTGPATRWVQSAKPGDTLGMFGPSALYARPVPIASSVAEAAWTLLVADEAALPATGTILEALPSGARAVAFIEVANAAEEQTFETLGDVTIHWQHRDSGATLVEAVEAAEFPSGDVFAWLGGEAGKVRELRRHLVNERGIGKQAIDFTGYWRAARTQDDAPTEADLADAQELLARAQSLVQARTT